MTNIREKDYKISSVKYYLNNDKRYKKTVKLLIVRNLLYEIGLKDPIPPKI